MRFLVSNDDGIDAPGIKILAEALARLGEVWVVAPSEERSTTGHALTLHSPLRLISRAPRWFAVTGTPADSVYVGLRRVMKDLQPDLVVSGINRGANLGQDVHYSGTVAAAREACMIGVPAMAVSTDVHMRHPKPDAEVHYGTAARMAVKLIRDLKRRGIDWPEHTLLNLNVPDVPWSQLKGLRLVPQGHRFYGDQILMRTDHRGRDYFWLGGKYRGYRKDGGDSDCRAVDQRYAALTPLRIDSTDYGTLAALEMTLTSRRGRRRG